ncbi:MAG: hypothetical protein L3J18_11720 [Candidatus Brocadia sp.]|jgi:hypothetical protein|uniref:Uncharacterized protein n=1 Tax=Candidatus Brocadia fulgida TaxID=380242 RepID=A0A0M2UYV1_9BACT|nr:MAG: hypothetical protein BROFUL_01105 [Candidatus Brocadia fulgida]UJS19569.1 MAG: hypothetical protein L3J18_11720 [Candidatus Brocadia sp.]
MEVVTREAEDFREMIFDDFLERRQFERELKQRMLKHLNFLEVEMWDYSKFK